MLKNIYLKMNNRRMLSYLALMIIVVLLCCVSFFAAKWTPANPAPTPGIPSAKNADVIRDPASTIANVPGITLLKKTEDSLSLFNTSGADMQFKTYRPLGTEVTIPKDAKFYIVRHYESHLHIEDWADWALEINLKNGITLELSTGEDGQLNDRCGAPSYAVYCNSSETVLGGKKMTLYTYKNNPAKMAGILGYFPPSDQIFITTDNERQLNDADVQEINHFLLTVKSAK